MAAVLIGPTTKTNNNNNHLRIVTVDPVIWFKKAQCGAQQQACSNLQERKKANKQKKTVRVPKAEDLQTQHRLLAPNCW
jgi:hypothetical protein